MKTSSLFAALSIGILAGCSNVPRFQNQQQRGSASVRCENPGLGGLARDDAFVYIDEIDGAAIGGEKDNVVYHLSPGKHQLGLHIATAGRRQATLYCALDAKPDRKYLISAVTRFPENFVVAIADDTDPKSLGLVARLRGRMVSAPDGLYPGR